MNIYAGGEALREARDATGFRMIDVERKTVELFGKDGAVRQPTISRYERGMIDSPTLEIITKLCSVYGAPVDAIIVAYGYPLTTRTREVDNRLRSIEVISASLPAEAREYFYAQLEHAAEMAMLKVWSMYPGARGLQQPTQKPDFIPGQHMRELYRSRQAVANPLRKPLTTAS